MVVPAGWQRGGTERWGDTARCWSRWRGHRGAGLCLVGLRGALAGLGGVNHGVPAGSDSRESCLSPPQQELQCWCGGSLVTLSVPWGTLG